MYYIKKILFLLLLICTVFCFFGCDKRDKLANNTMIVQIEPANDISCSIGSKYQLKSIIRNSGKEEVDEPVNWSVFPAELGEFDFSTSGTVNFTAKQSGEGRIYLSCHGVATSIDITVS